MWKTREILCKQILNALQINKPKTEDVIRIKAHINNGKSVHRPSISVDLPKIKEIFGVGIPNEIINQSMFDNVPEIANDQDNLTLLLDPTKSYNQFIPQYEWDKPLTRRNKVIVEFSSPNIAKPFHMGHLRSTIVGNFIANIFKEFEFDVIKLNYLGDWGTQCGYIQLGLDKLNPSIEEFNAAPISTLYNAYVYAHKLGETDPLIRADATRIFSDLETENPMRLKDWDNYRKPTVNELETTYKRLGVEFDEYSWESNYKKTVIENELLELIDRNLVEIDEEGRTVVKLKDDRATLIKSDGSTMYLIRDIAAMNDRFKRYEFDKMIYIVDHGQSRHFSNLFKIATELQRPFANELQHIAFGRIMGMSTRRGNVVFLKDILDEARDRMFLKQKESTTTKVNLSSIENSSSTDILGISAIIINDLKQRRQKDYQFNWDSILQMNGDTGIKLQYTHCRLSSLIELSELEPAEFINLNLLKEPIAHQLLEEISIYPDVLLKSFLNLEACILVQYLFRLCNLTSKALKELNIKSQDDLHIKKQRLLLFYISKNILFNGMKILGLQPLTKM